MRESYYFRAKGITPYPSPHLTQYFIILLLQTNISPILPTKKPENKLNALNSSLHFISQTHRIRSIRNMWHHLWTFPTRAHSICCLFIKCGPAIKLKAKCWSYTIFDCKILFEKIQHSYWNLGTQLGLIRLSDSFQLWIK